MSSLLELSGFQVATAATGTDAAASFEEFEPDAVVMDLRLSGMDGLQVCKMIRERAGKKPLMVAHTGWVTPNTLREANAAGFDRYIVKPGDPTLLVALLSEPVDVD